jgi:nicotinamidase-related amidase
MSLTLEPTNTALLVIDLQNGLFSKPAPVHQAAQLLENINHLCALFRSRNAPVVLIQHSNQKLLVKGS